MIGFIIGLLIFGSIGVIIAFYWIILADMPITRKVLWWLVTSLVQTFLAYIWVVIAKSRVKENGDKR